MKVNIDTKSRIVTCDDGKESHEYALYSREAFELISDLWLKVGWDQKYPYTFSWLGRPIIQLPEDMIRAQEVVYRVKPDVILETGVAHGGSLIFYASLCKAMGKGRVIGVDIEIRKHNRQAIEQHELFPLITLVEGSSIDKQIVSRVKSLIRPGERVLVILDSCHTRQHVFEELNAYHDLVALDSYIVATDGSMQFMDDVARGKPEWVWDNPTVAALEFVKKNPAFVIEQPSWPFNESNLRSNITHWPNAWLRRIA